MSNVLTDTITLPRATVQQALEALENTQLFAAHEHYPRRHVADTIDALRKALEQPEPKPDQMFMCGGTVVRLSPEQAAALEQPEQAKPVAWRTFDGEGGYDYRAYDDNENYRFEWDRRNPNHKGWVEPLYTHPPRREWRSLSEEEIKNAVGASAEFWATSALWIKSVACAIEAALRSKNYD